MRVLVEVEVIVFKLFSPVKGQYSTVMMMVIPIIVRPGTGLFCPSGVVEVELVGLLEVVEDLERLAEEVEEESCVDVVRVMVELDDPVTEVEVVSDVDDVDEEEASLVMVEVVVLSVEVEVVPSVVVVVVPSADVVLSADEAVVLSEVVVLSAEVVVSVVVVVSEEVVVDVSMELLVVVEEGSTTVPSQIVTSP